MGRRGIELEVKFAPAGEATLAELAARADFPGWRVVGRRDEAQKNTYYDTATGALEANRCSLRRRVLDSGASGVEWTFKRGRGPGRDGVARRREVNALLPYVPGQGPGDLPKVKPVARAREVASAQPLLPLFTLLTARHQIDLARPDGARVALALDRLRLADEPGYQESEIEIELLDGDERAVAALAVWLMRTYGLLPMRGSKRGRALAWRRGEGLPVVAPELGLRVIAERVAALEAQVWGRPVTVRLAAPRGSGQARALAEGVLARLPSARLVPDGPAPDLAPAPAGPLVIEGADALDTGHADLAVWVKAGLARPLLARLLADAAAAGLDDWTMLRRCGEYVIPVQRRLLDPAARWADLVVISNAPPVGDPPCPGTPDEQVKLFASPDPAALARAGAAPAGGARERDHFFQLPVPRAGTPGAELLRVRIRDDVAWVSFPRRDGETGNDGAAIAIYEARPRVLVLLQGLGYTPAGELEKERRRYRLGGWEVTLDQVAGLGHFCELRRVGADDRDADAVAAALGLAGARRTTATYLALWPQAQAGRDGVALDGVVTIAAPVAGAAAEGAAPVTVP